MDFIILEFDTMERVFDDDSVECVKGEKYVRSSSEKDYGEILIPSECVKFDELRHIRSVFDFEKISRPCRSMERRKVLKVLIESEKRRNHNNEK